MGKFDTSDLMMIITCAMDISSQSPKLKWASWTHTTPYMLRVCQTWQILQRASDFYWDIPYEIWNVCWRLTHWGQWRIYAPGRRQAIIWTNAAILLIEHLGTNFSEILIKINTFSFKKMNLKISSGKWRPLCLGLNVLTVAVHSITIKYHRCNIWTLVIVYLHYYQCGLDNMIKNVY